MQHPLIDIAVKRCYLNSHQDHPLVSEKGKTNEERAFRKSADMLVRDINNYPHAYVLACLMDTGVDADIAWCIPYRVYLEVGSFDIDDLFRVRQEEYINMFSGAIKWHRYPVNKAKYFYSAVQKIVNNEFMHRDASLIWSNKPSYTHFGVEFSDYRSIDIAPDAHTMRVFQRLGFTPLIEDLQIARIYTILKARELHPEFPGIVDYICWIVGREYCHPRNPKCESCSFVQFCEKKIQSEVSIWS